jgi:hypothetical protein
VQQQREGFICSTSVGRTCCRLVGCVCGSPRGAKTINWQEFRNSFKTHHMPLGVMKLEKKEFKDLKQGSMTVSEYVTRFTQLSRYAPDNVDMNGKKEDWFLNGLNDALTYTLEAHDFINFQDMVDKALVLKN